MKTLGIETSCDETAVALYDSASGIIAETVYSQIDLHKKYGGVVPELASRDHCEKIIDVFYRYCFHHSSSETTQNYNRLDCVRLHKL